MSNKIETLAKIQEVGIVAVVRATSIEQAEKITDACIAESEGRSANKEIEKYLKKRVAEFEKENGKIETEDK